MASSSSNDHDGQQQRSRRLVRHNSSFLGTIKNIVTAPLTWFANDDSAAGDKRRRPSDASPTERIVHTILGNGSDDLQDTRGSKRMRLGSPPRPAGSYLDPPQSALQQSIRTSTVPRASSAVLPSRSRATLSPIRRSIQRTMSIDPPFLPSNRRDSLPSTAFNFAASTPIDVDMAMDSIRDVSMPPSPLSPHPSFRMRASLTPQPQLPPYRHISEPPPLNSLITNPVFLHPPSNLQEAEAPTLGALVESVRSTRSPARQTHGSLLFASNTNGPSTADENDDAPAERALHQLDIYKTPLLPTRMRSSNLPSSVTATTTPDMFKSRRASHLVLMQDEQERLGKQGTGSRKGPVVNETKPYAGEGGMKKLLARRRHEVEEGVHAKKNQDTQTDDIVGEHTDEPSPPPVKNHSPHEISPPPMLGLDWFSTASLGSSGAVGSSLRVGRTKTSRKHLQRPSKARFSAVYEDDGDDVMDEEDSEGKKERDFLEEAAKKVPEFRVLTGFSFAKEAPPIKPSDLENAKEPPISSLPFSFSKASAAQVPAKSAAVPVSIFGASASVNLEHPAAPARVPTPEAKPAFATPASIFSLAPAPAPSAGSGDGIPNFFANSQVLAKAAEIKPAPTPAFSFSAPNHLNAPATPAAPTLSFTPSTPTQPVKDSDNPFWDGDKIKEAKSLPGSEKETGQGVNKPLFLFSGQSAFPPVSRLTAADTPATTPPLPFTFGKPTELDSFGVAEAGTSEPFKAPFPFGGESAKEGGTVSPAPAASTTSVFGEPSKSAASTGLGSIPSPFIAPVAPPQSTPSPLPFIFGAPTQPATSTSAAAPTESNPPAFGGPSNAAITLAPTIEAPKPLFGGSGGFTFGKPEKDKEAKPASPFTFGASPATPPVPSAVAEAKPSSPATFTFGASSSGTVAPSAPMGFSFGAGSNAADVSVKQPFMFGQPAPVAPNDRPVTPPKNGDQEFRMEESPTREMQQANGNKPPLSGFSFGGAASGGGTVFGSSSTSQGVSSPSSNSSPFTFGAPSTTTNTFGSKDSRPEQPKGFGGFGAPAPPPVSTSFSFGKTAEEAQRPSSGGGFAFNSTPTSATASSPAFGFGQAPSSNPFSQSQVGSAPSSPSTFNQSSPFAFGAPAASATTTSAPFSFGSQPSSPAGGTNLNLPQLATGGFGGGATGFGTTAQQPSSPFSPSVPLATSTSSGGSLFTIGAAPAPPPPGQQRQIRKLPNRRATGKR